jgi:hypothetical protein
VKIDSCKFPTMFVKSNEATSDIDNN